MAAGIIFGIPLLVGIIVAIFLFRNHESSAKIAAKPTGFNMNLPSPNLPSKAKDKLQLYQDAEMDSLKRKQEREKDPYAGQTKGYDPMPPDYHPAKTPPSKAAVQNAPAEPATNAFQDPNEKKVSDRLQKLYALIQGSSSQLSDAKSPDDATGASKLPGASPEMERLQSMMATLQQKDTAKDPKLTQINALLDKVLDVQHPERVKENTPLADNSPKTLLVSNRPLDAEQAPSSQHDEPLNGFFGLVDDLDSARAQGVSIKAVINTSQTVQTGSIVKLRLTQDMYVGGVRVPANSFIYGPCAINGERVDIQLTNAIVDGQIYPIDLSVYDGSDGLAGLYVPGAITRDVLKQNMSQGVSGVNLATLDPSLGAQAMAAGIETAKNLLSQKIRIVKVTLTAGHLAILRSPHAKN